MENQLRFDLGDRHQYLDALMEGKKIREYESWQIYFSVADRSFFLGTRSRGPVETDHTMVEKLSIGDALWLRDSRHVITAYDSVDEALKQMSNDLTRVSFLSKVA